ncbi:MAG: serpin family protein [Paludibacteraceae bacterium]|nr:serpin family protein [Paludibacteraceae bacterium]
MNTLRNILFSGVVLGLCALLFVLFMLASCSGNGVSQPRKLQLSVAEQGLVQDCNDFSFNLLAQVASSEKQENIILSPLSASMLLGMLMNGADGETLAQMRQVTGFEDDATIEEINAYYKQLIEVLPALDTETTVRLANGIWVREDFPVIEDFIQACKQSFEAEAKNVPTFVDNNVLNEINRFAAQHTNNLIKQVIDPSMVDENTAMALVNALYFKAKWQDKFKKADTKPQVFTTLNGEQIQANMLRRTGGMRYGEDDDYQLLELPYKGGKYCADIILPAKGIDIRKWVEDLDAERWQQMLNGTSYPEVEMALPKFALKYSRRLNDDLSALGMSDAFGAKADFSRLSKEETYVDLIHQYTFMQVDEEGTEAAAVTIGLMVDKAAIDMPEKRFIADRPFVLLVREKDYGTILFAAIIGHPEWE